MSGKRIVEEIEERFCNCSDPDYCMSTRTVRRTLTEGQYVLIEKVDGAWPEPLGDIECWVCDGMGEVVHDEPCDVCAVDLTAHVQDCPECGGSGSLLDALSDHTEGTP